MTVTELYEMPEKAVFFRAEKLELNESDDDRQISLLAKSAWDALPQYMEGHCVPKFHANLVLDGYALDRLTPGTRLRAGEVELVVTPPHKKCYDFCALIMNKRSCPLPRNTAFARVTKAGTVRENDTWEVLS